MLARHTAVVAAAAMLLMWAAPSWAQTSSIEVSASTNPSNVFQVITLTATVTSDGLTPTGTVQFEENGFAIGAASVSGSGTTATAALDHAFTVAGTYQLTASYSGDANLPPASSPQVSHQVNGTPAAARQLIISEFRLSGPNGPQDEFIEIYNASSTDHTVATNDGSSGYGLYVEGLGLLATLPNGLTIPKRGHYLIANRAKTGGYSLGGYSYGWPDDTYDVDLPTNGGLALFNSCTNAVAATRLDSVGFEAVTDPLYYEGVRLLNTSATGAEYTFARRQPNGPLMDRDSNRPDFDFLSTTGATFGSRVSRLGAPGPQNRSSPLDRTNRAGTIIESLIDVNAARNASPNRERVALVVPNGQFGTMEFRRRYTNRTRQDVYAMRFRVVALTTKNAPVLVTAPQADLRVLSSSDLTITVGGRGTVFLTGITLEEPPVQPVGGGFNSSLRVPLPVPLAPDASIDVRFELGVERKGNYAFYVVWEALEGSNPSLTTKTPLVSAVED